jgi:FAD/FMN-containing dehydrogenase
MTTSEAASPTASKRPVGSSLPPRRRSWLAIAVLVAFLVVIVPLRRALQLAADPEGAKDCGPVESGAPASPTPAATGAELPWLQRGGTVNDASCLSRTPVHGVVQVRSADDVRQALAFARRNGLKVSAAGVKHSMGGHAFARGGLVLDMTSFTRMSLDAERRVLTVESGATWHDIQNYLHPRFAVKAMQSTDIFTVAGSISVNAHGMDHQAGSVGRTIRAMRVMLADGTIRQVSATENADLFNLVVGGYGLFGIILDVDLEVTENVVYQSERHVIDYHAFLDVLNREILPDTSFGLMYGHLSTSPSTFLDEMLLYTYRQVDLPAGEVPPLGEVGQTKLRRLVFNLAKLGPLAMRTKWLAEKHLEPLMESCPVARTQAMGDGEACLVSRNHPMHDSVAYLRNQLPAETDILHEYFVPQDRFVSFVDRLRSIAREQDAKLLNASVRVVHRESNTLSYAPADHMLAVVLYLNQSTDREGNERMARLTSALIDACADNGGRFFLPYQLHYSSEQLLRSYPEIGGFFAAKRAIDPEGLFSNTFYEKYGRTGS